MLSTVKSSNTLRIKSPIEFLKRRKSIARNFSRCSKSINFIIKKPNFLKESVHPVKNKCALILQNISNLYSVDKTSAKNEDIYSNNERITVVNQYEKCRNRISRMVYLKYLTKNTN